MEKGAQSWTPNLKNLFSSGVSIWGYCILATGDSDVEVYDKKCPSDPRGRPSQTSRALAEVYLTAGLQSAMGRLLT